MTQDIRILLMEDDRANRLVVSQLLRAVGYEVLTAENGREGLDVLETCEPVQVVITDSEMPVLDGCDATRAIRASRAHAHLPIIILSGHSSEQHQDRFIQAGADAVLTKPARLADLQAAVVQVLGSRAATPASTASAVPEIAGPTGAPLWDRADLLSRVEGDAAFLVELMALSLQDLPHQLRQLRTDLESGSHDAIRRSAHRLKGAASNAAATRMSQVASKLEDAARDERPRPQLQALYTHLARVWGQTEALLREEIA